jgi:hypothetical protein
VVDPREPLEPDLLDARRAPRVPVRLAVELRHHRSSWRAETDDVGPRGCQVVTPHALPAGRDLQVAIAFPRLARTVTAAGRVAWSRAESPARLGISFEPLPRDRDWFDALLRELPAAALAARNAPLRLPADTPLHLGEPPAIVADFSEDELAVLRAVGAGTTAGALAGALAGRFRRARGPLFSLVSRRLVLVEPAPPGAAERWGPVLYPRGPRGPLEPPPRPPEAQRLFEDGIAHLGAGRVDLALARFREALAIFPGDAALAATLARLERWR